MAKMIKYKFVSCEVDHGTEEAPNIEQIILDAEIVCETKLIYDANLPVAEGEAIPGTLEITGEFAPEHDTTSTDDVLNALLGVSV